MRIVLNHVVVHAFHFYSASYFDILKLTSLWKMWKIIVVLTPQILTKIYLFNQKLHVYRGDAVQCLFHKYDVTIPYDSPHFV